jgi:hypothetical protein
VHPVRVLKEEGHEVTLLFYNPNVHPLQEYLRRREALASAAEQLGVRVIWLDREYDPQKWFRTVTLREANRCMLCHHMRLERALSVARRGKFDAFSTTMLYSRMQNHDQIAGLGRDLAGNGAPTFLYRDFRDDWQEGIETSRELGLYRQQYCGCLYSENERYKNELQKVLE